MNGYWEAVLGAAFGLPGTARPRQPAPFEAYEDSPPLEVEQLLDAPHAAATPAPSASARPPSPAAPARTGAAPPRPVEPAAPSPAVAAPAPEAGPRPPETRLDRESPPPMEPALAHAVPPAGPLPGIEEGRALIPPLNARSAAVADPPLEARAIEIREGGEIPAAAAVPAASAAQASPSPSPAAMPPPEPILVAAEPAPAMNPPIDAQPAEPPPALTIEIGRIDVRILAPDPPPAAAPEQRAPLPDSVPSLADYLARRNEAGR